MDDAPIRFPRLSPYEFGSLSAGKTIFRFAITMPTHETGLLELRFWEELQSRPVPERQRENGEMKTGKNMKQYVPYPKCPTTNNRGWVDPHELTQYSDTKNVNRVIYNCLMRRDGYTVQVGMKMKMFIEEEPDASNKFQAGGLKQPDRTLRDQWYDEQVKAFDEPRGKKELNEPIWLLLKFIDPQGNGFWVEFEPVDITEDAALLRDLYNTQEAMLNMWKAFSFELARLQQKLAPGSKVEELEKQLEKVTGDVERLKNSSTDHDADIDALTKDKAVLLERIEELEQAVQDLQVARGQPVPDDV